MYIFCIKVQALVPCLFKNNMSYNIIFINMAHLLVSKHNSSIKVFPGKVGDYLKSLLFISLETFIPNAVFAKSVSKFFGMTVTFVNEQGNIFWRKKYKKTDYVNLTLRDKSAILSSFTMSQKINQSSVVEVKQCSPWYNHRIVGQWYDLMHERSYVLSCMTLYCAPSVFILHDLRGHNWIV